MLTYIVILWMALQLQSPWWIYAFIALGFTGKILLSMYEQRAKNKES